MTIKPLYNALTTPDELRRIIDIQREALEIIAGRRQCLDNLMSNADVAEQALTGREK